MPKRMARFKGDTWYKLPCAPRCDTFPGIGWPVGCERADFTTPVLAKRALAKCLEVCAAVDNCDACLAQSNPTTTAGYVCAVERNKIVYGLENRNGRFEFDTMWVKRVGLQRYSCRDKVGAFGRRQGAHSPLADAAHPATQPPAKVARTQIKEFQLAVPEQKLRPIAVCAVFPTVLDFGGVEMWWWSLYDACLSQAPFYLHAVEIRDFYSDSVVRKLLDAGIRLNLGGKTLMQECDVILQTGVPAYPTYAMGHARPLEILVVHGGSTSNWTKAYAKFAPRYDGIVAVSQDAVGALPVQDQARAVVIPTGLDRAHLTPKIGKESLRALWNLPVGKKVLLFLGRISSEKNPGFFVDVVQQLGPDWIGVLVGPLYFTAGMPDLRSADRVFLVGPHAHPADAVSLADVMICPSPDEGGPIVLLEAWGMEKAMFMFRTGIAAQFPSGVFMMGKHETPQHVAERVMRAQKQLASPQNAIGYIRQLIPSEAASIVNTGHETFLQHFDMARVSRRWQDFVLLTQKQRSTKDGAWPVFSPFETKFMPEDLGHELRSATYVGDGEHGVFRAGTVNHLACGANGAKCDFHFDLDTRVAAFARLKAELAEANVKQQDMVLSIMYEVEEAPMDERAVFWFGRSVGKEHVKVPGAYIFGTVLGTYKSENDAIRACDAAPGKCNGVTRVGVCDYDPSIALGERYQTRSGKIISGAKCESTVLLRSATPFGSNVLDRVNAPLESTWERQRQQARMQRALPADWSSVQVLVTLPAGCSIAVIGVFVERRRLVPSDLVIQRIPGKGRRQGGL
jgi:glycosyltransferase involved in cell wall biosynthesis